MLNFGLSLGGKGVGRACPKPQGEIFDNPDFNCGMLGWKTNEPGYTGSIDELDSAVRLTAQDPDPDYFSIGPNEQSLPGGKYLIDVNVTELSAANGWKFSVKDLSDVWWDLLDGTTVGDFTAVVDMGDVKEIHIGHKAASDGEYITFDHISMMEVDETRTPCLTGPESPYGHCEASHVLDAYYAWKGMDCSNAHANDAWITPVIDNADVSPENEEVWFGWWLRDEDLDAGMPLMVPTKVVISPRKGMSESWWTTNNPYRIRVKGILEDMSEVVLVDEYRTDDWIGSGSREITITTDQQCRGLKLYILGTKGYDGGGTFHTAIGASYFEGVYPA